jgi:hypothetical protein
MAIATRMPSRMNADEGRIYGAGSSLEKELPLLDRAPRAAAPCFPALCESNNLGFDCS